MKKCNSVLAFLIIGTVGTLWHFVYELSGGNGFIALFAPVNESVWEHLKLLFFPAAVYFIIEYFLCGKEFENYISASAIGIFTGTLTITAFYYTYSGIIGRGVMILDILSYFLGLFLTLYVKRRILKNKLFCSVTAKYLSLALVILTAVLFGVWSFYPPRIALFIPPTEL